MRHSKIDALINACFTRGIGALSFSRLGGSGAALVVGVSPSAVDDIALEATIAGIGHSCLCEARGRSSSLSSHSLSVFNIFHDKNILI